MQIRFDDISVPTEKLDQVVSQNMYDIKRQYKKRKHWNYLVKGTVAAVAALTVAGVCVSHPALAAKLPLIGHIFERVQEEQLYPGNFNEVAEPVREGNVSENQGITMTLSEIYSDSRSMYVSAMIESEEPFPEGVKDSNMLNGDDIGYHMYLEAEQELDFMTPPATYDEMEWPGKEFEWTPLDLKGEYVDEHTYVGAMRISFDEYPIAGFEVPDTFQWKLKVSKVTNLCEAEEQHFSKEGTWEFETDVSVDQGEQDVYEVNKSAPNGEVIKKVTKTPYETFIEYGYDESKVEAGYERYDSVQSTILDADGKRIEDKVGSFPTTEYNLSRITIYYWASPTEEAHAEVQEKIYDEAYQDHLEDYLEEIAVRKIEVDLE